MNRSQTWCDWCQRDEPVSEMVAAGMEGNDPDLIEPKWTHGYCPEDPTMAAYAHGWVEIDVQYTVPAFKDSNGKEVVKEYGSSGHVHICAWCLRDPEFPGLASAAREVHPTMTNWRYLTAKSQENNARANREVRG